MPLLVITQVSVNAQIRYCALLTHYSSVEAIEKGVNDVGKFDAGKFFLALFG